MENSQNCFRKRHPAKMTADHLLEDVKENPGESAKDIFLTHADASAICRTAFKGRRLGGNHFCPKQIPFKKAPDVLRCYWRNNSWTDKTMLATSKPHASCMVEELFWCLRACTACCCIINRKMNSQINQDASQENVTPSVCQVKVNRSCLMLQHAEPKHRSKFISFKIDAQWLIKSKGSHNTYSLAKITLNSIFRSVNKHGINCTITLVCA